MIYKLTNTEMTTKNGTLECHLYLEITMNETDGENSEDDEDNNDNNVKEVILKFAITPEYFSNYIPVYIGCNQDGVDIDDIDEQSNMSMFYEQIKYAVNDAIRQMNQSKNVKTN